MDSKYIRRFLFLGITGLLIAALWNSPSAYAMASISPHTVAAFVPNCNMTVTNTNDSGAGSLRHAIENTSCPGSTNVLFDSSLSGQTITLTSGQITINDTTTIDASSLAEPITISGNNNSRHFLITNGMISINFMIFTNGRAEEENGGSINIENFGSDSSDVTIQNSQFIGNEATYEGGAIRNEGTTITISQSSFIDNVGGTFGGGVSNNAGTATITNSTFYHNQSSAGGALTNYTTIYLQNNTFVDNGAVSGGSAIYNWETLRMSNNLVVGTISPPYDAPDCQNTGTLVTNTNNWIEDNSCSPAFSGNPLLSPVTDNGGPTLTAMPRLDSPVVNAGNCSSGPATDQRGQPRPQNNTCDIGAVEVQQPLDTDVTQCGLVQGNTYLFRATGVQLTIGTLGGLNCISTEIFNAVHPNATASITAPYVTINATTVSAAPYQVTMTLLHDNLSNPFICKYSGAGGWDCGRDGYDNYTLWRSGISSFSDWAIGNNANAPVANANSYTTPENTLLNITAPGILGNDTDADGDSLTAVPSGDVSDGSLTLNSNGSFSYTPDSNFCGTDSFTYRANDGTVNSNVATVTINVTCSNEAPIATADEYTMAQGTTLTVPAPGILGNDTDADGDSLTAVLDRDVSSGNLILNSDGSFSYTPPSDICGNTSFEYHAHDGTANSNVVWVTITIPCVPFAVANSYTIAEDTPLSITAPGVLGNDMDFEGDSFTAVLDSDVTVGSLILNSDGSFSYTPDANFCGTDSFTYHAKDDTGDSNIVPVTINVTCHNDAPVANSDSYTTAEDTLLSITAPGILGNDTDADGDSLTAVLDADVSDGSLSLNNNGSFSYTPNSNFCGPDSFTYHANDGSVDSNVTTVTINVSCGNDAPVASTDSYSTAEDVPLTITVPGILGNDTDTDGDSLTAVLDADVGDGSLTLNSDGSFSYTPDANFCGSDSFTYHANDGTVDSNTVTVTIDVTCSNDPPVANGNNYTTPEDTPLTITAPGILGNDTDADGDSLTAVLNADVGNGSLSLNSDGSFSYTPDANFCGSDSFTYHTNDSVSNSTSATVTIDVTCANDAPVAANDSYNTAEEATLNITAPGILNNDTDADGDSLTAVLDSDVSNGSLTLNSDGSFSYTPDTDYCGSDSFTYHTHDGTVDSNSATVTITIICGSDTPVANNDSYTTDEDTPLTITIPGILGNDTDADGDSLTAVLDSDVSNGSLNLNSNGSFSYTPNSNFCGTDSFSYHAHDGAADSNSATVTIAVTCVNDAPAAQNDNYSTNANTPLTIAESNGLLNNDNDLDHGDTLTIDTYGNPANGVVTVFSDGSFVYTPTLDFDGIDSFNYTIMDTAGMTATASVSITVITPEPERYQIFLPMIANGSLQAPDLVVTELSVTADDVQVVITNQGNTAVSDDFWVDVYINPDTAPTGVNQTWVTQGGEGLVWGVTGITLAPGQSLTLTLNSPYYNVAQSNFSGTIAAGSAVYAQADAANLNTTYGNILETHEMLGTPYNNITMITTTTAVSLPSNATPNTAVQPNDLPLR